MISSGDALKSLAREAAALSRRDLKQEEKNVFL